MSQSKIKLTDIVSPKELSRKQRAPIHLLNNSIKRNTITACQPLTYDCKLPKLKLSKHDIAHMLRYLLAKEEMSLPDRNLVRRIIVEGFDEELLHGNKDFIRHIRMVQGREGEVLVPESRQFCMLLRGKVRVSSGMFEYEKDEGEVFGELELLSECQIGEIVFVRSSIMITLEEEEFSRYFAGKYQLKYVQLQRQLDCLQEFLRRVPKLCRYMLLSKVERRVYALGEKIVLKGEALDHIIVVGDKLKDEQLKYVVKGCIGLYQLKKGKPSYEETVYSSKNELELFFVKVTDFQSYIIAQNSDSLMKSSHLFMDNSFARTTVELDNPEGKSKIVNFMRVRKVRLVSEKRSRTEPHSLLDNEFKFLNFDCLGIEVGKCDSRSKTRYKSKNSFSVARKRQLFK